MGNVGDGHLSFTRVMFRVITRRMNGIFAIEKPSGVTSSKFLGDLQAIFTKSGVFEQDLIDARNKTIKDLSSDKKWSKERINKKVKNLKVKLGHGGTLDPLASGVLVIGVGDGTKKLSYYLGECNKTYNTRALLGLSTTTGDSEGEIISKNKIDHISKESVLSAAEKFVGDLEQTPPIFSALKMNGKALYDYAREGLPLPKPIKSRKVKVFDIKVRDEDLLTTSHEFVTLKSQVDENGVPIENNLSKNPTLNDSPLYFSDQFLAKTEANNEPKTVGKPKILDQEEELPEKLPLISLRADVSSGTYIRSLVSDIGRSLESSAYMVELIRIKQSDWELGRNVFTLADFTEKDERLWGKVLKKVLDDGPKVNINDEFESWNEKLKPLLDEERRTDESRIPSDKEHEHNPKRRHVENNNVSNSNDSKNT